MASTLQQITDAWGNWLARQHGTAMTFTAATNYAAQAALSTYTAHECKTAAQKFNYGGTAPTASFQLAHTAWYDNPTAALETQSFDEQATTQHSYTWTFTRNLDLGVKIAVTEATPDVVQSTQTGALTLGQTMSTAVTATDSKVWKAKASIDVPANSSVEADMVLALQSFALPFTQDVLIKGDVAVMLKDAVALPPNAGTHQLWFFPIEDVLADVIAQGLADARGYQVVAGGIMAGNAGTFTGNQGIGASLQTTQYGLRQVTPPPLLKPLRVATLSPAPVPAP